jgi:hypothetical protein
MSIRKRFLPHEVGEGTARRAVVGASCKCSNSPPSAQVATLIVLIYQVINLEKVAEKYTQPFENMATQTESRGPYAARGLPSFDASIRSTKRRKR